jgi:ectoine hydroxylase-related dioxygenase (phytanoyl-CoA dioxygenase family)
MSLSEKQVQDFKKHGYTLAPHFFNDREVRAMRLELERFQREGLLRNVATDGDGKSHSQTKANLQICPIWSKSRLFRAVPFANKSIAAVRRLIGDPVVQQLDQIFLKPARSGAPTNWHQDNSYFNIADPLKGTAMWIALHDANEANGTIRIVPDSHLTALEHKRDSDSDHHIRCWPDESKAVLCELKAGGVAFFCYGTPHATGPNRSDQDRAGLALHFLTGDQAQLELLNEPRNCRPYLTGPKASGGLNEYGEVVDWDREVDAQLALITAPVVR